MNNLTHSIMSRDFSTFQNFKNARLHNACAFPTIGKKGLQVIEMIHNGSSAPLQTAVERARSAERFGKSKTLSELDTKKDPEGRASCSLSGVFVFIGA